MKSKSLLVITEETRNVFLSSIGHSTKAQTYSAIPNCRYPAARASERSPVILGWS